MTGSDSSDDDILDTIQQVSSPTAGRRTTGSASERLFPHKDNIKAAQSCFYIGDKKDKKLHSSFELICESIEKDLPLLGNDPSRNKLPQLIKLFDVPIRGKPTKNVTQTDSFVVMAMLSVHTARFNNQLTGFHNLVGEARQDTVWIVSAADTLLKLMRNAANEKPKWCEKEYQKSLPKDINHNYLSNIKESVVDDQIKKELAGLLARWWNRLSQEAKNTKALSRKIEKDKKDGPNDYLYRCFLVEPKNADKARRRERPQETKASQDADNEGEETGKEYSYNGNFMCVDDPKLITAPSLDRRRTMFANLGSNYVFAKCPICDYYSPVHPKGLDKNNQEFCKVCGGKSVVADFGKGPVSLTNIEVAEPASRYHYRTVEGKSAQEFPEYSLGICKQTTCFFFYAVKIGVMEGGTWIEKNVETPPPFCPLCSYSFFQQQCFLTPMTFTTASFEGGMSDDWVNNRRQRRAEMLEAHKVYEAKKAE